MTLVLAIDVMRQRCTAIECGIVFTGMIQGYIEASL